MTTRHFITMATVAVALITASACGSSKNAAISPAAVVQADPALVSSLCGPAGDDLKTVPYAEVHRLVRLHFIHAYGHPKFTNGTPPSGAAMFDYLWAQCHFKSLLGDSPS
jgi:hypothetical protein